MTLSPGFDERIEGLTCVGGPWAGKRVLLPPGRKFLTTIAEVQTVTYERVAVADALPTGETVYCHVLALSDRRSSLLRELIAGYARAFERT